MIDLAHVIALALEAIYDPKRQYGYSFWVRNVERGGATPTMLREAFIWLGENPQAWEHLYN